MNAVLEQLRFAYERLDNEAKALLWAILLLTVMAFVAVVSTLNASTFHDVFQGLAGLFTVIAIVVGGSWTYMAFVRTRQRYPSATLAHQIRHKPVMNGKNVLTVILTVSNQSQVRLELLSGFTWIQQMVPWPDWFLEHVEQGRDPVAKDETEIGWPIVARRDLKFEKAEREVEPGENDEFHFDFVLDDKIETVVIYTYLKNHIKRGKEIGWGITSVYDLRSTQEGGNVYGAGLKEEQNR